MTDPQVAVSMLGLFLLSIFLGFPICFTLMAMAVFFGYYAYFDAGRMWRGYERAVEQGADSITLWQTWFEGLFNNRIFDLFINQTYSVMANDVLTAVPLFLFMGYIVERANIVTRLFDTLYVAASKLPGAMAVAALATCAMFATATGIIGAVVTLMGLLAFPAMLRAQIRHQLRLRRDLRRRLPRHSHPAFDHADRLRRHLERLDRQALCRRHDSGLSSGRPLHDLCHRPRLAKPEPGAPKPPGGRDHKLHRRPDRPHADHLLLSAGDPHPVGAGRDPVRSRHAVGSRLGRRARRPASCRLLPLAYLGAAAGKRLSDRPHLGDGVLAVRRLLDLSLRSSPISAASI